MARLDAIWEWLENNKLVFTILEIAVGFFFVFFGRKFIKIIIFIVGVGATVGLCWVIFYSFFLKDDTSQWVGWAVFAVGLLLGGVVGFLLTKFLVVGAFLLAGWGGFSIGLLLYNAFFHKYIEGQLAFWGV